MTTTTVPIQLTCPDWCEVPANEHVRDLWYMEGNCIHHSPAVYVVDKAGFHGSLEPERYASRAELNLTSQTDPNGKESAPPVVHLYGAQEMTVSQALALADAIRHQVEQYRACGGVA